MSFDVEIADGRTWRVTGKRQPSEAESLAEYQRLLALCKGGGNFSIWRTTAPDRSVWNIFLCGAPELLPEFAGEEHEVSETEALLFVSRRLRLGAEAFLADPTPGEFEQEAHYAGGALVQRDGSISELET